MRIVLPPHAVPIAQPDREGRRRSRRGNGHRAPQRREIRGIGLTCCESEDQARDGEGIARIPAELGVTLSRTWLTAG